MELTWGKCISQMFSCLFYEGIGVYTLTASPRAPCIVMRHAILSFFDQWGLTSPTSKESRSNSCDNSSEDSRPQLTPKKQVVWIMHGALKKKDFFFLDEVYPLYFSEKYSLSKSNHIHRKVKCAHLVPEPVSRWRRHVVPRLKRKVHVEILILRCIARCIVPM